MGDHSPHSAPQGSQEGARGSSAGIQRRRLDLGRRVLRGLDTRRLALVILFLAIFTMAVRAPADTDTWWHLQAGRVTLEQGRILQTDLFSHTRYGSPWVNHSWLSQVILYWLFDTFAYAGLGLWVAAVVTTAFVLVYVQMEGDVFSRAFILVLAAATSAVIWSARPQLFSLLLTAAVAYVLYLLKWRGVNRLWLLPPIFALWVNLHAGYALGFMILAGFVGGELVNHLIEQIAPADDPILSWRDIGLVVGASAISALVLVVNPNTTRMWTYYLETVQIDVLQDVIQEWRSPDFHPLYTQPFIWLLLSAMAAMGLSKRRADGTDLTLISLFAYAALLAGRNIGPFAVVAAPVLSRHLASLLSTWRGARPLRSRAAPASPLQSALNWVLLVLVTGLAVVKIVRPLRPAFNQTLHRESLPVDAVAWIEQHKPDGKMFNHYNWGGYLIWRLWPDYAVFVDGRTDLYGDAFLREYLKAQTARPGFQDVLNEYDVNWVLMPVESTLGRQLACQPAWRRAYQDDVAAVWIREDSGQ